MQKDRRQPQSLFAPEPSVEEVPECREDRDEEEGLPLFRRGGLPRLPAVRENRIVYEKGKHSDGVFLGAHGSSEDFGMPGKP